MEKLTTIPRTDFRKGFYIQMECAMCMCQATFAEDTEDELQKKLDEEGWKEIDSDEYQLIGHHCGCDYRDL
jgi:hypothetical protein